MHPLRRLHTRTVLGADTWERHEIVASVAGSPRRVLDLGGERDGLAPFLPGAHVLAANVAGPADLRLVPGRLPFADAAWEVVTSLDVLEHVPPADRAGFVREAARVTDRRLVLCCPLGTPEHEALERETQAFHIEMTGDGHRYVAEHLANGLPTCAEVAALLDQPEIARRFTTRLAFHGDARVANRDFKLAMRARHRASPRTVGAYARYRLAFRPDLTLADRAGPYSNRVFAIATRRPGS